MVEHSLLEKILITLLRQPSKLLLGLSDKQQSMIHVAVELYQGLLYFLGKKKKTSCIDFWVHNPFLKSIAVIGEKFEDRNISNSVISLLVVAH